MGGGWGGSGKRRQPKVRCLQGRRQAGLQAAAGKGFPRRASPPGQRREGAHPAPPPAPPAARPPGCCARGAAPHGGPAGHGGGTDRGDDDMGTGGGTPRASRPRRSEAECGEGGIPAPQREEAAPRGCVAPSCGFAVRACKLPGWDLQGDDFTLEGEMRREPGTTWNGSSHISVVIFGVSSYGRRWALEVSLSSAFSP